MPLTAQCRNGQSPSPKSRNTMSTQLPNSVAIIGEGANALTQKPRLTDTQVVSTMTTRKMKKRSARGFRPALQYTIVE